MHPILFALLFLLTLVSASFPSLKYFSAFSPRDLTPVVAADNATIGPTSHGYVYMGCYNETLGLNNGTIGRALAGGKMESNATTTTQTCLSYCASNSYAYAGLEYGQECWCATYLSYGSTPLNASVCDLACVGNTSQICGGRLALTLFNLSSKSGGASGLGLRGGREGGMGWASWLVGGVGLAAGFATFI